MKHIAILKKIASNLDTIEKYSELRFGDVKFEINSLLKNSDSIKYCLKVLEIPFNEFEPIIEPPIENKISIGCDVDLKIVFFIAYFINEMFKDEFELFINYNRGMSDEGNYNITFGSYIHERKEMDDDASDSILPDRILSLDIENTNWEDIKELFPSIWAPPNNNYISDSNDWSDDDNFRDAFDSNDDAWNHWNQ